MINNIVLKIVTDHNIWYTRMGHLFSMLLLSPVIFSCLQLFSKNKHHLGHSSNALFRQKWVFASAHGVVYHIYGFEIEATQDVPF